MKLRLEVPCECTNCGREWAQVIEIDPDDIQLPLLECEVCEKLTGLISADPSTVAEVLEQMRSSKAS